MTRVGHTAPEAGAGLGTGPDSCPAPGLVLRAWTHDPTRARPDLGTDGGPVRPHDSVARPQERPPRLSRPPTCVATTNQSPTGRNGPTVASNVLSDFTATSASGHLKLLTLLSPGRVSFSSSTAALFSASPATPRT